MRADNPSPADLGRCFNYIEKRAQQAGEPIIKYLTLGTCTVRLFVYSVAFISHIEKHLAWSLSDNAAEYCATLVVWQDNAEKISLGLINCLDPAQYHKLRAQKLTAAEMKVPRVTVQDESAHRTWPLVDIIPEKGVLSAWNPQSNTWYYAVNDLSIEELIKRGHLFVQSLYRIVQSPSRNIAHGAVVGLNNTGILFCGMGYRGKSTLTVNALLDGFEYVSDDYFILEKQENALRAWPIYSMVALSPDMYYQQFIKFNGKFLCNNARKDKYIFNIAAYHEQFRPAYPIKLCMYLRIANCAEPNITLGDKNIAIEELVGSTLMNTGTKNDVLTTGKLYGFVDHLPFYRFDLSTDLDKNTRCLRDFLHNIK